MWLRLALKDHSNLNGENSCVRGLHKCPGKRRWQGESAWWPPGAEKWFAPTIQFFSSCCHHTFPSVVTLANLLSFLGLGFLTCNIRGLNQMLQWRTFQLRTWGEAPEAGLTTCLYPDTCSHAASCSQQVSSLHAATTCMHDSGAWCLYSRSSRCFLSRSHWPFNHSEVGKV